MPLDVSEIAIKRRLYRSGESEYYINNQQVKLKDVRELFWDTGVGKAAYSVMEQGKIDRILSSKPVDRRYLFEEAAGITRFKAKRAEAERTLKKTEENIRQAEGILNEVKRSYDTLKVQANKTITYRQLKDDIFNFELDIQLLKLKGFIQDKDRKNTEISSLKEKRDKIKEEIDLINASVTENMDDLKDMNEKLVSLQKEVIQLATSQNGKKEQSKLLIHQQNEAHDKVIQLEQKKHSLEESIDSLNDEIGEKEVENHDLEKRLSDITKNIKQFEENISLASKQITDNDRKAADYQDSITELENKRLDLQKDLASITDDIVKELDARLKDAGYSSTSRNAHQEKVLSLLKQLQINAAGKTAIISDFEKIQNHDKNNITEFISKIKSSFEDIAKLTEELQQSVDSFIESMPLFIDDFLSPEGIITKKRFIDQAIDDNRNHVEKILEKISELKTENSSLSGKIDEYKATLEKMRINEASMKTKVESADEALKLLKRQLTALEAQKHDIENDIFNAEKSLDDIKEQVEDIQSEIAELEHKGRQMNKDIEKLDLDIKKRNSAVEGKQESIRKKGEELAKTENTIEKINLDMVMSDTEIRNIKENFRESHSRDLMEFEERMYTLNVQSSDLRDKRAQANQKLKELGSVNLMALEEFAETKERYDFLFKQLSDLNKAREDLNRITEEIRAESTELFMATYNKIKKNFHNMFRRLMGGGQAELKLVNPENVPESGVDIFARPPGKKLENISLLSGGEKTMTAVSLLFATYMVRPSPFCLLDEIDAALDEHNVKRFAMTLREFASVSQYIVITHNTKTATSARSMLGVTMEEFGVSKIITIKVDPDAGTIALPDPEPFEEEEVAPELDVVIPPHQPKRKRGPNGEVIEERIDEESQNNTDEESL